MTVENAQRAVSKRQLLVGVAGGTLALGGSSIVMGQPSPTSTQTATGPYSPAIRVMLATPLALDKALYLSGSFNGWGLGERAWKMTPLPDGSYAARLPDWVRGNYEFKFHLGDWSSEAVSARGAKLGNFNATFSPRKPMHEYTLAGFQGVPSWPLPNSTATPGVTILSNDMAMPQLNRTRRIWVYLPPGYGAAGKRYRVIYMHDGQNVFDRATSFAGEWGVDETLARLARDGDEGAIVVAINNGERNRSEEYHPINPDTGRQGRADDYLAFIVSTLKPRIDAVFATKPDRLNTAIMGASSGGSISLYAALKYPEVFGKAAMFSTPLWVTPRFDAMVATTNAHRPDTKLWFTCGAKEKIGQGPEGMFAADQPALIDALVAAGFSRTTQLKATIDPDGQHNEAFWGRTFEDAYKWLFSA
jgi:predicted alpha/beta superfamily hydrolase